MKYEINKETNFDTLRTVCSKCKFAWVDCLSYPCKRCRSIDDNNSTDTDFETGTIIEQWYIKNSEI